MGAYSCSAFTPGRPSRAQLVAFFSRISVERSTECWLWQGTLHRRKGYGYLRSTPAHRFAYAWFVEPIAENLTIDHLCRVRRCVNPAHLEAVTNTENVRRGNLWARTGRCRRGHDLSDALGVYVHPLTGDKACRECHRIAKAKYALRAGRDSGWARDVLARNRVRLREAA